MKRLTAKETACREFPTVNSCDRIYNTIYDAIPHRSKRTDSQLSLPQVDKKNSPAVASKGDRTAYDVPFSCRLQNVVWNSRGQHEYLPIYSFALKSAFGARELFCRLCLNDISYSKSALSSE